MGNKADNILSMLLWNDNAVSTRNKMFYRFCIIVSDWIVLRNRLLLLGEKLLDGPSMPFGTRIPKR